MTITLRAVIAATCLALPASGAMAATFDFNAMADAYTADAVSNGDGPREATYAQMTAFNSGFFTDDGISITNITSGGAGSHAFFDHGSAGLGVCSSGIGGNVAGVSNCSSGGGTGSPATGDDNVTAGENVKLTFDTTVAITDLLFRASGHGLFGGTLMINGDTYSVTAGMLDSFAGLDASTMFDFAHIDIVGVDNEFYLTTATVSAVPLPAGLLLMGTALGGFGLMRRRRKAA